MKKSKKSTDRSLIFLAMMVSPGISYVGLSIGRGTITLFGLTIFVLASIAGFLSK